MEKVSVGCLVMSYSLQSHGLYCPWNSLGKNTGVGWYFLVQGIFPTQGSNPGLPHCRQILYHLSHQGKGKHLINSFNTKVMKLEFKPISYLCIQTSKLLLGRTKCLRPKFRIQGLILALPLTSWVTFSKSLHLSDCIFLIHKMKVINFVTSLSDDKL